MCERESEHVCVCVCVCVSVPFSVRSSNREARRAGNFSLWECRMSIWNAGHVPLEFPFGASGDRPVQTVNKKPKERNDRMPLSWFLDELQ